jgi:hypothetical protein
MLETAIVAGVVALLVGGAALASLAPLALIMAGAWLLAGGLAFGVPTGVVYHLALRRSLLRAQRLPPRWWLRPTSLHGDLPESDRGRVLAWCYAGALGFFASLVGCALVALGAFLAR